MIFVGAMSMEEDQKGISIIRFVLGGKKSSYGKSCRGNDL